MRQTTRYTLVTLVATTAVAFAGCTGTIINPVGATEYTQPGDLCGEGACETATVDRVIDGDTLDITGTEGEIQRVRVLGIDTPETVHPERDVECMGPEASAATGGLATAGSAVTIVSDPRADSEDDYGRRLAHVVATDGTNLGENLLERGLATTTTFPHSLTDHYTATEDTARSNAAGIWSEC
ncbi:thermonuclease family protein [Corynebacterium sp. AOP40-9SA-29]|uniref:thermonuclease family protein n=1 Tax=Corynebacterium sp. AOP40-9SA-29 TaxID=3457677 RepID=UPI004033AADF